MSVPTMAASSWETAERELGYRRGGPINIGWYCSDRLCDLGLSGTVALRWEDHQGNERTYTYDDLRTRTNTFAQWLRCLGIKPGERVCLFMDRVPELYLGFLAILKMGGIAQPLFSAFGEESLWTRLDNAGTTTIITQKKHVLKVRKIRDKLPELKHVVVVDAAPGTLKGDEVALALDALPALQKFDVYPSTAETPSVLHYTSGTTGQPKGAQHVHYSLISQYLTSRVVLDLKPGDIYWCNADPGWVTGTSYGIIGPWACGVTQVVLDAGFQADRWYAFLQKHRVTVWYSAPTAIRLLMREGSDLVRKYDLSSLRHLCSVGEPLNAEAVIWSEQAFGRPFHDTFWQTESGCIVITNLPGLPVRPGSMGKPFPGIEATVLDPQDLRAARRPGTGGPHRPQARLALDDAELLEEPHRLPEQVQERLVSVRRPGEHRSGRVLLVRGARRRRDQYGWPPGGAVRDRVGAARAPGGGRVGGGGQARPDQHGGREGLRDPEAGLRAERRPRARDHEHHPPQALAAGHAPGNRVHPFAPEDAERQDRTAHPAGAGVRRAGGRRLIPDGGVTWTTSARSSSTT